MKWRRGFGVWVSAQNPLCDKALDRLRQIKVGEMRVGDTATLLATEVTAEQKEIMRELGVPPAPHCFSMKM